MPKKITLANMSPAARAARIKVLAANPGTRSAIPDKYLPTQYKAGRATAQRVKTENATLYNPAQILSGPDLRNAVKSEVDLQINPKVAAYDRGISSLTGSRDVSGQRLGQYFDLYNKSTAASASALSSSGQQLAQKLADLGQQTQSTLGNIQSGITQRTAADAAVRGPGLQDTSNAQGAVDFAKAQSASGTQSAINQAAGTAAGTNTLAGTIAAVAPMKAQEAQTLLANKFDTQIADMMSKRADTEAQRGDLTTTTLNKMRQDQFTNLATAKGLDLKQADLNETVRKNKATEKLTGQAINQRNLASIRTASTAHEKTVATNAYNQAQIDIKRGIDPVTHKRLPKSADPSKALAAWKLNFAQTHGFLPPTGAPKGGKGDKPTLTPNEKSTQTGKFASIISQLQSDISGAKNKPANRIEAGRTWMGANPGKDPLAVSIGLDVQYDGHVSRANAKKLHDRGLTVKDLGLPSYQEWKSKGGLKKGRRSGAAGSIPGLGNTTAG